VMLRTVGPTDPQDYMEGPLPAGSTSPGVQPTVGPFPTGSYRLTVTLAQGITNTTEFTCIDIIDHSCGFRAVLLRRWGCGGNGIDATGSVLPEEPSGAI